MTKPATHLDWETCNDLADGVLEPPARAEAEQHLAACEQCRSEFGQLSSVLLELRSAPVASAPPALWQDIHAAIAGDGVETTEVGGIHDLRNARNLRKRSFTLSAPMLAAAALLLVVSASAATLVVMRSTSGGNDLLSSANAPAESTDVDQFQLTSTDQRYLATVQELERQLDRQRQVLRPATIEMVERSLQTIDTALAEARVALLADPANTAIRNVLESTYRQKVDFLRRATQIASTD